MLATVGFAFSLMLITIAGMAIGAIFTGRTIKGSCGGINNVPGIEPVPCVCEKPCEKRLARMAAEEAEARVETKPIHFDRRT